MAKSQKVVLGVDIGGTKIAAGLVNSEGKILYSVAYQNGGQEECPRRRSGG